MSDEFTDAGDKSEGHGWRSAARRVCSRELVDDLRQNLASGAPFEKLKKCPLIETICEFRFPDSVPWDATVPGRLHEAALKKDFPVVFQPEIEVIELAVSGAGGSKREESRRRQPSDRIQFKTADGKALVQVGPRMISANSFAPYGGWEADFQPRILRALDAIVLVLGDQPLARLGLRYINRIPILAEDAELSHYLTTMPSFKGALRTPLVTFYHNNRFEHTDPLGVLIHQTGLQRHDDGFALMLDLDFFTMEAPTLANAHEARKWIERAHSVIINSFNDSITAELFEQLKGN